MQFKEEHHFKINGTIMVIGEIIGMYIKEDLLKDDGFIDLAQGKVTAINGLDGYSIPKLKTRLPYQRPKKKTVTREKIESINT